MSKSILRVWDCFFYEGRKILFRVALTILRQHESEITKVDDPMEVFQVVQARNTMEHQTHLSVSNRL